MIRVLGAAVVVLDCGCKVRSGNVACWYHHEREHGVAYPGCEDCRFDVPPVVHCLKADSRRPAREKEPPLRQSRRPEVSTDYQAVQKALNGGADPAMLCATCPWDRNCFSPPTMTSAEVEAQIQEAGAKDKADMELARSSGREAQMPVGTLMTALIYAGKDTSAQVCPVFGLRLRSSGGRKIADTFKSLMQEWDDQK